MPPKGRNNAANVSKAPKYMQSLAFHTKPGDSMDSLQWWSVPLLQATEAQRSLRPAVQARNLVVDSLCTGSFAEADIFKVLGISTDPVVCADMKQISQEFCMLNYPDKVGCWFDDLLDVASGLGPCRKHGRTCRLPVDRKVDLTIAGPPCQPFSKMRTKRGADGLPAAHADYRVFMRDLPCYVDKVRPGAMIIEQVAEITQVEEATMMSPLHAFMRKIRGLGLADEDSYAITAVRMTATPWLNISRDRVYILMISKRCGGDVALKSWVKILQDTTQLRQLNKPAQIEDVILSPEDARVCMYLQSAPACGRLDPRDEWKGRSAKARTAMDITFDYAPYLARMQVSPKGVSLPRELDVIEVAWATYLKEYVKGTRHGQELNPERFHVDVSQDVTRKPWALDSMRCLTKNSKPFIGSQNRILMPAENFLCQGRKPLMFPKHFAEMHIRDLAGEGFFAPVAALAVLGYFLSAEIPGLFNDVQPMDVQPVGSDSSTDHRTQVAPGDNGWSFWDAGDDEGIAEESQMP
eukprot:TRINITY_DN17077_c0_g1_i1.p2 TRINITY_DN17077_c0_g1~~TRINITY_DN17077_c0_g1_i1.p2  ORF type:complete len:522 (+),score=113.64 TRINITY_DN17077_c0_g1_i1:208-1773(+)